MNYNNDIEQKSLFRKKVSRYTCRFWVFFYILTLDKYFIFYFKPMSTLEVCLKNDIKRIKIKDRFDD